MTPDAKSSIAVWALIGAIVGTFTALATARTVLGALGLMATSVVLFVGIELGDVAWRAASARRLRPVVTREHQHCRLVDPWDEDAGMQHDP